MVCSVVPYHLGMTLTQQIILGSVYFAKKARITTPWVTCSGLTSFLRMKVVHYAISQVTRKILQMLKKGEDGIRKASDLTTWWNIFRKCLGRYLFHTCEFLVLYCNS